MPETTPLSPDKNQETSLGAVEWVAKQECKCRDLWRSVPPVAAVHEDALPLVFHHPDDVSRRSEDGVNVPEPLRRVELRVPLAFPATLCAVAVQELGQRLVRVANPVDVLDVHEADRTVRVVVGNLKPLSHSDVSHRALPRPRVKDETHACHSEQVLVFPASRPPARDDGEVER